MRKYASGAVLAIIIFALAGLPALAKGKSSTTTFRDDFEINGTAVKRGTYKVSFDQATNELLIEKDGKVIAKAPAHAEAVEKKADRTEVSMETENGTQELRSVSFAGERERIVVGEGAPATQAGQAQ